MRKNLRKFLISLLVCMSLMGVIAEAYSIDSPKQPIQSRRVSRMANVDPPTLPPQ